MFENMAPGSAQPVPGGQLSSQTGGGGVSVAWHSSVALARTTFIKNSLDQLSQLMWVKVAAGPTVTLLQLFQDFGVKMLIFRVDDQIIHFGFWALTICH
jgi:hypothetical protein